MKSERVRSCRGLKERDLVVYSLHLRKPLKAISKTVSNMESIHGEKQPCFNLDTKLCTGEIVRGILLSLPEGPAFSRPLRSSSMEGFPRKLWDAGSLHPM